MIESANKGIPTPLPNPQPSLGPRSWNGGVIIKLFSCIRKHSAGRSPLLLSRTRRRVAWLPYMGTGRRQQYAVSALGSQAGPRGTFLSSEMRELTFSNVNTLQINRLAKRLWKYQTSCCLQKYLFLSYCTLIVLKIAKRDEVRQYIIPSMTMEGHRQYLSLQIMNCSSRFWVPPSPKIVSELLLPLFCLNFGDGYIYI